MNSLKKLLLAKSIAAAAIVIGGIAAPSVSHAIAFGAPASGMVCRAGYTGAFSGTNFKCSKTVDINVVLECTNPTYPTYTIRAVVGPTGVGRDFCTRSGIVLGPTDSIANLVLGAPGRPGDYVLADVNPATVVTRTGNQDQTEATAQGLAVGDVDTVAGVPVIQLGGGVGNKDNAKVTLTHFTFAIPTAVIGSPGPLTGSPAFVPRPLP